MFCIQQYTDMFCIQQYTDMFCIQQYTDRQFKEEIWIDLMVEAIKWHSDPLLTFRFSTSCIQLCCSSCYKLRILSTKNTAVVVKFAAEFTRFISNICVFVCPNGPPSATENGKVIKLIAVSMVLGNEEFLYIDREESILCLDRTGLCYLMIE